MWRKGFVSGKTPTTRIGYVNRNGQRCGLPPAAHLA
jgi:hypothetical protein